jgi:hypothetical protein
MITRLRSQLAMRVADRTQDREGGVAMLLALFVIATLVTISITVAGVTLSQIKPTQLDRKAVSTEDAAEGGFDAALNRIRTAYTGTTTNSAGNIVPNGDYSKLPCSVSGYVNSSTAGVVQYQVTLNYYTFDPTQVAGQTPLTCTTPGGTASVPAYVQMVSRGSAADVPGTRTGSSNRVVQTVYALSTTNQNIAGGQIPFVANQTECLAVYDTAGKILTGDPINVATCSTTSSQQKWSYTANLQLETVATDGSLQCMQGVDSSGNPTTASASKVVLAPCSANSLPPASPYTPPSQVFSYNDGGQFQISNSTDTGLGSACLNLYTTTLGTDAALNLGDYVDLSDCGSQFVPTASVGAGAAGTSLRPFQLVNYLNFGRCIDDTNQQVAATWMIGYPCKQDPLATNLTWNQKYYVGTSGGTGGTGATASYGGSSGGNTVIASGSTGCQISDTVACQFVSFPNGAGGASTQYYCLEAGSTANPSAPVNGTLVSLQPCSTGDNYQQWTYTKALVAGYANQYQIRPYGASTSNLCLSMTIGSTPPGVTYSNGGGAPIPAYGYISLQTCTGTGWQKWNAPPNPQSNGLKNTYESTNGS